MAITDEIILQVVAEPTGSSARSFDIVALHGLGGSWNKSWTSRTGYFWLRDLLPVKFASSRILSFQVPKILEFLKTSLVDVTLLIEELIHQRQSTRRTNTPIIFIGHSVGGNILKQIFVSTHPDRETRREFRELHESIQGYIFLGTPQNAITFHDYGALIRTFDRNIDTSLGGNEIDLEDAFKTAARINQDFRSYGGEVLPACCFYERAKTWILIVPRSNALYKSRTVYDSQLNLEHQQLSKLGHPSADPNTRSIIAGFQNILQIIESPDFNRVASNGPRRRSLNILSCDGGGVKGLFSLLVLKRIMHEVETRIDPGGPHRLPCDYFDLIAGTSTGGLIAIMLGRLQMDVGSAIKLYLSLSREIFDNGSGLMSLLTKSRQTIDALAGNAMYDGDVLKRAICNTVNEQLGARERESMRVAGLSAKDVCLVAPEAQKSRCFVCAVSEGNHRAERIRSYLPRRRQGREERDTASYKIWEAARATSAAPIYFPPIEINGRRYFDGGLNCNNPILEVIDEARHEFEDARIDTIVSIGTGKGNVVEPHGSLMNVLQGIIHRVTSTEWQHEDFLGNPDYDMYKESYFRFQAGTDLGSLDLAAVDRMEEIELLAEEYLSLPDVKQSISNCASRILYTKRF